MSYIKETSDSSRLYRPNSSVGSSDISTTGVPDFFSDMPSPHPELQVKFQITVPVYVRPKLTQMQPINSGFSTSCD